MSQPNVKIPREFQDRSDLVAIPQPKYEKLLKLEAEMNDALGKIRRGNRALKEGKAQTIKSVRELM